MEETVPSSSWVDLDVLDAYLTSDHAPDACMGLSDLDGFLTGIVVGPEVIPASEWLSVVWGGEEPNFETEDEMRTVLGTIMGRYNEILSYFNSDPHALDPILWEGPAGEVIAAGWAAGFLSTVELRPEAWKPLLEDDDARLLIVPLLLLNGDLEFIEGPDRSIDESSFLADAPDTIPVCVAGIHKFWKNYHDHQRSGQVRG